MAHLLERRSKLDHMASDLGVAVPWRLFVAYVFSFLTGTSIYEAYHTLHRMQTYLRLPLFRSHWHVQPSSLVAAARVAPNQFHRNAGYNDFGDPYPKKRQCRGGNLRGRPDIA